MNVEFDSQIEQIVEFYLRVELDDIELALQPKGGLDFEVRIKGGPRVFLEVIGAKSILEKLDRIERMVRSSVSKEDKFYLVTRENPTASERYIFEGIFSNIEASCQWIALRELPSVFGKDSGPNFTDQNVLTKLQLAAVARGVTKYSPKNSASAANRVARNFASYSRQLSPEVIGRLSVSPQNPEATLRIAQRVPEVTVVLADIVNFSSMVVASRAEDLSEAMSRYYRLARSAVFDHGGMLDKFIGDSVLAVFGYPFPNHGDSANAIRFGCELVGLGGEVLGAWSEQLNAVIETGTRVGIATGDIWPLNIGASDIELALLGDTINLAARLESNCSVNCVLFDNRTRVKAQKEDIGYVSSTKARERLIAPGSAKGQQFEIRGWECGPIEGKGKLCVQAERGTSPLLRPRHFVPRRLNAALGVSTVQ